jgi:H+/Cl- antiporter ClcA
MMIPLPKLRGFWDYALFALGLSCPLVFLFWVDATNGLGWADVVLALGVTVLFVLAVILARRREKARWIAQPTWHVHLVATLGAFALLFGAMYADAYFFHRGDITSNRLRRDLLLAILLTATTVWMSRRGPHTRHRLL